MVWNITAVDIISSTSTIAYFAVNTPHANASFTTKNEIDHSGFTNSNTELPSGNETLTCIVSREPARIVLEVSFIF